MQIDDDSWKQELETHSELFDGLSKRLPREMVLKQGLLNLSFMH